MSGDHAEIPTRASAARMRRLRQRRKEGMRYLGIELFAREIDTLVRRGLLNIAQRDDVDAICTALYRHLDRTLC